MTTIILVRHGTTSLNQADRYRGQIDVPLNETGEEQAQLAGQRLRATAQNISAIYASTLLRASRTAEIIAQALGSNLKVEQEAGLTDIDLGKWSGLTPQEAQERFPAEFAAYQHDKTIARGGGESHQQVQDRAVSVLQKIATAQPDGTVVVVSHGAVIKTIVAWIIEMPIPSILTHFQSVLNLSFTYLEIAPTQPNRRLVAYNLVGENQIPVKHEQSEG